MTLNKRSSRSNGSREPWQRLGSFVFGVALALAVAASQTPGQTGAATGTTPKTEKYLPGLSHEIHHQLATLPFYSVFDSITFTLEGRKVTLSGQVVRPLLKKHAETAVKSLEGVDTVVNQIEVLPESPTDDELRRGIYRAIYEDPELAPYAVQTVPPIHIIVKNGSVALEGTVKSAADKNLAGMRAGGVTNVTGVKNNLSVRVSPAAEQGDVR